MARRPPPPNNSNPQHHFAEGIDARIAAELSKLTGGLDDIRQLGRIFSHLGVSKSFLGADKELLWESEHTSGSIAYLRDLKSRHDIARKAGLEGETKLLLQRIEGFSSAMFRFLDSPEARERAKLAALGNNDIYLPILQGRAFARDMSAFADKNLSVPAFTGTVRYTRNDFERGLSYDLQLARAQKRIGGGVLDPEDRQRFSSAREKLVEEMTTLSGEARTTTSIEDKAKISYAVAAKNNLVSQIDTLFKESAKQNKTGLEKTVGVITQLATILSVGSLVSKFTLQDPYTFGTMPAINAISKQGEVGAAVGAGMSQTASYELGLNQQIFGAGMTAFGLGVGGIGKAISGGGGGWGTAAALGGGALLAGLGITGAGTDMLQALGWAKSPEQIMGVNLAQQMIDPQRVIGNFNQSRAGMLALNDRRGNQGYKPYDDLGYYFDDAAAAMVAQGGTGNRFLDEIYADRQGQELRNLGIDSDRFGGLLSQSATMLSGRGIGIDTAAITAARVGGAYGLDEGSIFNMMGAAQGYASPDIQKSLNRAIGAGADASGNISTFTVNTISAALMNTVQSLKLQNIARNSEDLEKEVFGFRQMLVSSDTELGKMVETNPQAFARIINNLQTSAKSGLTNPGMLSYDLSLGSSMADIVMGRSSVTLRRGQDMMNRNSSLRNIDVSDGGKNITNEGWGALFQFANVMEIDPQTAMQLVPMFQKGMNLDEIGAEYAKMAIKGEEDVQSKVMEIITSTTGDLMGQLATQVAAMTTAANAVMKTNEEMNGMLLKFITDGNLMKYAQDALEEMKKTINNILGVREEVKKETLPYYVQAVWDSPIREDGSTFGEVYQNSSDRERNTLDQAAYLQYQLPLNNLLHPQPEEHALGGATGIGNRLQGIPAMLHGGEYVISDNRVKENRELLDRIQSGENVQETGVVQNGDSVELTMRISGMSVEQIKAIASRSIEDYVIRNRLNYS